MLHEDDSMHIMALYKDRPIGCCRLRESKGMIKFERLGILKDYRKK